MNSAISPSLSPTLSPLVTDRTSGVTEPTKREQMEQVGAEFESVFLSMMIKTMRETLDDGLFPGENSDSFGGMFDMFIGKHMAEAGGIGLKQMLVSRYEAAQSLAGDNAEAAAAEPNNTVSE